MHAILVYNNSCIDKQWSHCTGLYTGHVWWSRHHSYSGMFNYNRFDSKYIWLEPLYYITVLSFWVFLSQNVNIKHYNICWHFWRVNKAQRRFNEYLLVVFLYRYKNMLENRKTAIICSTTFSSESVTAPKMTTMTLGVHQSLMMGRFTVFIVEGGPW